MLTLFDYSSRFQRRDFLQIGSLALASLGAPRLLSAGGGDAPLLKDRSVIFLFLHGGPSQTETFDPKMSAPAGVRSVTGEIGTSLPGVTFGSTFEKLARHAHEIAVVRSFKTGNGNHDIKPVLCSETLGANIGSMYARIAGSNNPATGMVNNAILFPRSVVTESQAENLSFGNFKSPGELGSAYAPFVPSGGGAMQESMELRFPRERLDDRRLLLSQLDSLRKSAETGGPLSGSDKYTTQAFETILGGVSRAFDLSQEDPRTVASYDTAPLVRPHQISKAWNNYNNYVDNARSLGKLLLLSRRLCEAGCGFVTVTTNFVWDMHADNNNATMEEGMDYMGRPLDHALSAFIEDIRQRGLSEKILLVVTGEMGRTPKVNAKGGRDHWGNITPLLLYGGGLNMGQVVGQSTKDAAEPFSRPWGNANLIATIMHSLMDIGQLRLRRGIPSELLRAIADPEPITELVST